MAKVGVVAVTKAETTENFIIKQEQQKMGLYFDHEKKSSTKDIIDFLEKVDCLDHETGKRDPTRYSHDEGATQPAQDVIEKNPGDKGYECYSCETLDIIGIAMERGVINQRTKFGVYVAGRPLSYSDESLLLDEVRRTIIKAEKEEGKNGKT